jgi:hypothetical protein
MQQCPGLLQVHRIEAFAEPAVDLDEHAVRCGTPPLVLPEPCQARGSPQFSGPGLLTAGNNQGLLEAGFSLDDIWNGLS